MAHTEDFEKAWRAKFHTDIPPDLGLGKMDSHDINKILLECKARMTEYQRKLHQQEFIHRYLTDILQKSKPNTWADSISNVNDVNPASDNVDRSGSHDSLERKDGGITYRIRPAIPPNTPVSNRVEDPIYAKPEKKQKPNSESFSVRQKLIESSINQNLYEHNHKKLEATSKTQSSDNLSQPNLGNYVSLDYSELSHNKLLGRTGSDSSIPDSCKKFVKPIPTPRLSVKGPAIKDTVGAIAGELQERLSMKKTESPANVNKEEEKAVDKRNLVRRNHQYDSVYFDELPNTRGQMQQVYPMAPQQPATQPPYMHTLKPRTLSTESSDSASILSSFRPLPSAKEVEYPHHDSPPPLYKCADGVGSAFSSVPETVQPKASKMDGRAKSFDSNVSPESPKLQKITVKHAAKEHIYDAPVPVRSQDHESDSSSDEEPIYLNILLLKQRTMQKTQTMYSSLDDQKKQVENRARHLSKKFTQSLDMKGKGCTLPPKFTPPMMKPVKQSATIAGVTTTGNRYEIFPLCIVTRPKVKVTFGKL